MGPSRCVFWMVWYRTSIICEPFVWGQCVDMQMIGRISSLLWSVNVTWWKSVKRFMCGIYGSIEFIEQVERRRDIGKRDTWEPDEYSSVTFAWTAHRYAYIRSGNIWEYINRWMTLGLLLSQVKSECKKLRYKERKRLFSRQQYCFVRRYRIRSTSVRVGKLRMKVKKR